MRGRFAPSPTGDLHLGGAYVALVAHDRVRAQAAVVRGGAFVVRMEDLDPPRVVLGAATRILDDLEWLGLSEDEGPRRGGPYAPYAQSARGALYDEAIAQLAALGHVYPCTCSRAEIARAASAPHAGEEGPHYPGTCRDPSSRKPGRPVALRLRIPDDERRIVSFNDAVHGPQQEDVAKSAGDFVLRRGDGVASYQLAVVVDDAAMEIDEVVRGDDLLASTGRQILLAQMLSVRPPRYVHVPVVRGPDGARLAKRHQSTLRGTTIGELREAGISAAEVTGEMRRGLADLRTPWQPPTRWLAPR